MEHTPTAPDEADVAAILDRLRAEVSRTSPAPPTDGALPQVRLDTRRQAERYAFVTVDRPFLYRPGPWGRFRGLVLAPVKSVVRKLMRWYVEPAFAEQRGFNAAVLDALDELGAAIARVYEHAVRADEAQRATLEEVAASTAASRQAIEAADLETMRPTFERELTALRALTTELEERTTRVERRMKAGLTTAPTPAPSAEPPATTPQSGAAPLFDYFAFESRMRESRDSVRARQSVYVDEFRDASPVLDIGCGRGEFLELLRHAGVDARGIDTDADMVAFCVGEGLDVEQADALSYLERLEGGSLGGVFCAHVVEHLPTEALVRMLALVHAKLRPNGVFVAETPNPRSLVALRTFFADLTHEKPLHPETLAFLVREAGFERVELRYLNEPPPEGRLRDVLLPEEAPFAEARGALATNVDLLNDVVFGPQDYAVVARA